MKLDLNDPKLTAYALGELNGSDRAAIEEQLAASPAARQEVERIREISEMLRVELQKEPAGALSQLQRIAIESEAQRRQVPRRRFPWVGVAVAASLFLAIGAYFKFHKERQPILAQSDSDRRIEDASPKPVRERTDLQDRRVADRGTTGRLDSSPMDEPAMPPEAPADDLPKTSDEPPVVPEEPAKPEPEPVVVASAESNGFRPNPQKMTDVDDVTWINDRVKQLWQENGIKPSEVASDGEFIRRAYLDIIGQIPPAEESAAYIRSRDKDKKAKLIISLLNTEAYTRYWAENWSNLLVGRRPARNRNIDTDSLKKFLRDCFAANKPWNQVVYELVTATGGSTPEALKAGVPFNGATNFLLAHMNDGNVPATAFTTRLFLGVQVQCTQCHDHPFNDRLQESFWGINAFFQKMRRQEHNDVDDTGRRRFLFAELTEQPVTAGDDLFVRFDKRNALVAVVPPQLLDGRRVEPEEQEIRLRESLASYIIERENEYFAQAIVNRLWSHFLGRGIVHPADDLGTHNPASNPDLLTRLAENFRESNYDLKRLMAWITLSVPYSLSSETNSTNKEDDQYFSHFPLKQMSPEQFFDSLIVASQANRVGAKSNWEAADKLKEELQRQFTAVFNNDENAEADTFNGTIPQALMLMNGELIQKAISKEKGSYLRERVDEINAQIAKRRVRSLDQAYVSLLNDLYLSAVSRYPTAREKTLAMELLNMTVAQSKEKDPIDAYQDIFWALLNSSEFVLNH